MLAHERQAPEGIARWGSPRSRRSRASPRAATRRPRGSRRVTLRLSSRSRLGQARVVGEDPAARARALHPGDAAGAVVGAARLVALGPAAELRPHERQHAVGDAARLEVGLEGGQRLRTPRPAPRPAPRAGRRGCRSRRPPRPWRRGCPAAARSSRRARRRRSAKSFVLGVGDGRRERVDAVVLGVGREPVADRLRQPRRRVADASGRRPSAAPRRCARRCPSRARRPSPHTPRIQKPASLGRGHRRDGRASRCAAPARARSPATAPCSGLSRRPVAVEPAAEPAGRDAVGDQAGLPEVARVEVREVGVGVVDPRQEADLAGARTGP